MLYLTLNVGKVSIIYLNEDNEINIANFMSSSEWSERSRDLLNYVKEPPFAEGFTEVLVAGEPERIQMAERLSQGIPIDDETWKQILEASTMVGVSPLSSLRP